MRIHSTGVINWGFWDYPILLDGGWRFFNGDVPSRDFSTSMGVGLLGLVAVGIRFVGAGPSAIDFAQLAYGVVGMALCIYVVLKRFSIWPAFAFCLIVASYFFTPRMLSGDFSNIGYSGLYNLLAFALFTVLLAQQIFSLNKAANAVLSALIVFALIVTKFPFGLAGFALVVMRMAIDATSHSGKVNDSHTAIFVVSLALLLGALFSVVGYKAMVRDILIVSQSRESLSSDQLSLVFGNLHLYSLDYAAAALSVIVLVFNRFFKAAAILAAGVLAGLLLTFTIQQLPENPVLSVVGILAYTAAVQAGASTRTKIALFIMFVLGTFNPILANFKAIVYQQKLANTQPSISFDMANVAYIYRFHIYEDAVRIVKELNGGGQCSIRLLTVDAPNPLSAGLRCPPAKNTPLYWHNGTTFSPKTLKDFSYFEPTKVFADVDVIFVPTKNAPDQHNTREPFMKNYWFYLNDNFKTYKTTKYWHVFVRPSLCKGRCSNITPSFAFSFDEVSLSKLKISNDVRQRYEAKIVHQHAANRGKNDGLFLVKWSTRHWIEDAKWIGNNGYNSTDIIEISSEDFNAIAEDPMRLNY